MKQMSDELTNKPIKKYTCFLYVLCLCALIFSVSGCTKNDSGQSKSDTTTEVLVSEVSNETTESESEPESETEAPPLLFKTSVNYDKETRLQQTTLDTQGYSLTVYFEIPVFEGKSEGVEKINDFFQELNKAFFSPENENLVGAWEIATTDSPENTSYYYTRSATITQQTEDYASVCIVYDWWMGGVDDYGSDSYVFSTETGEQLQLTDLIDADEQTILSLIIHELETLDDGRGDIDIEAVKLFKLNDFEFQIVDGKIKIMFDKYEASYGAYGAFEVELPVEIQLNQSL